MELLTVNDMNTPRKLIVALYILSRFAYRIIIIYFVSQIFFEVFTTNGKMGGFSTPYHHSKGYPVTAKMSTHFPDSIMHYNNKFMSGTISNTDDFEEKNELSKIKTNTTLKKTYEVNKYKIWGFEKQRNTNKIVTIQPQNSVSEVSITVNPKEVFFKSILLLKTYLVRVLLLFICYQFMLLFRQLKNNFSFDPILTTIIRRIGFAILILQSLQIIVSLFTMYHLTNIDYYHYVSTNPNFKFNIMRLDIIPEYDTIQIFIGLGLLLLAKLLDYGNVLQQENELTI